MDALKCKVCGRKIPGQKHRKGPGRKRHWCSTECRQVSRRIFYREYHQDYYQEVLKPKRQAAALRKAKETHSDPLDFL